MLFDSSVPPSLPFSPSDLYSPSLRMMLFSVHSPMDWGGLCLHTFVTWVVLYILLVYPLSSLDQEGLSQNVIPFLSQGIGFLTILIQTDAHFRRDGEEGCLESWLGNGGSPLLYWSGKHIIGFLTIVCPSVLCAFFFLPSSFICSVSFMGMIGGSSFLITLWTGTMVLLFTHHRQMIVGLICPFLFLIPCLLMSQSVLDVSLSAPQTSTALSVYWAFWAMSVGMNGMLAPLIIRSSAGRGAKGW